MKSVAPELRVAHASGVLANASRVRGLSLTRRISMEIAFKKSAFRRDAETITPEAFATRNHGTTR
jgi:hypothetical protein